MAESLPDLDSLKVHSRMPYTFGASFQVDCSASLKLWASRDSSLILTVVGNSDKIEEAGTTWHWTVPIVPSARDTRCSQSQSLLPTV